MEGRVTAAATCVALALACAGLVIAGVAAAGPAGAAIYVVQTCTAGMSAVNVFGAWTMRPDALQASNRCDEGHIALAGTPGSHLKAGDSAHYHASAPDGTTFAGWRGRFQGRSGTPGVELRARACFESQCADSSYKLMFAGLENWGAWTEYHWRGSGALAFQLQLLCALPGGGCPLGAWAPGLLMASPQIDVEDPHPPAAPAVAWGALGSAGWKSARYGPYAIGYQAADRGGGVAAMALYVDGALNRRVATPGCAGPIDAPGARAWSRLVPCPLQTSGTIAADLSGYPDGPHDMVLTASDPGGSVGTAAAHTVQVDSTPPASVADLAVEGGGAWRNANGFTLNWHNPAQTHSPLAAVHWRLCPAGTGGCTEGTAPGGAASLSGIEVPASGEHDLSVWLEDAAGNHDPRSARPVTLRLDTERPRLAFRPLDPQDPLRVAVAAEDPHSGVATGGIEIRRHGTHVWQALATAVQGRLLVAGADDERLPAGGYDLRARATDGAGNQGATEALADGSRMTLRLPLRAATRVHAGIPRVRRIATRGSARRARGRAPVRRLVELAASARVRFGRRVTIRGFVELETGRPLARVPVEVWLHPRDGAAPARIGTAHTDRDGGFAYRTRARASRVLDFRYAGSRRLMGSARKVALLVPAATTLRVDDRRLLGGQRVLFSGRLTTRPFPAIGKLLEVQSFFRDHWRTFSTVRADARGRWRFRYRFTGTVGRVRYRFRVVLPEEGGYPFERGTSRELAVIVTGL